MNGTPKNMRSFEQSGTVSRRGFLWRTGADLKRPPLPPGISAGGHGRSHGYCMNEFVFAILQDRKQLVDVGIAINLTVAGIISHRSAMQEGELLRIPQYNL